MSNWEKVTQDKELLSKVEDWVRGLSIDSPQEMFHDGNYPERKGEDLDAFDDVLNAETEEEKIK